MHKIILSSVLLIFTLNTQASDRFSTAFEYEVMNECVGVALFRSKKIALCACALKKTASRYEDWWLKYMKITPELLAQMEERMAENMKSCKK
jgi:hypothetical protein